MIGQGKVDNDSLYPSGYTFFAHGSAMIFRRSILETLGNFPELFFLYYEEVDYSYKARLAGYKIFYNNKAVIYHRVSYSTGEVSTLKTYYMTRNRIMFMERNFSRIQFLIFIFFFTFLTIPKNTFKYLFISRTDLLSSFYKAIWWNIKTPKERKIKQTK